MWIEAAAFFLGVSILLYCLLAGADFGAGILESVLGKELRDEQRKVIDRAMGPVWEANHVWLILAVVILFVAFPSAYTAMSITFHIPLTLMLLGVILRGSAFTFRHYDAVRDRSQSYYSAIFVLSSFVTPMMLGIVAGGMLLGRIGRVEEGFHQAFVRPWANLFCVAVGIFTCVLFAFLAAVYLIGETSNPAVRRIFIRRAQVLNVMAMLTGCLVFAAAELDGLPLASLFMGHALSFLSMTAATLILVPLWAAIRKGATSTSRVLAAVQVGLVLAGWFRLQFPVILNSPEAPLTIYSTAAPESTLRYLLYALAGGSVLIFPSLFYLLRIFKVEERWKSE
jgi:cytochrome bd ubiquinol oxidase subunit II